MTIGRKIILLVFITALMAVLLMLGQAAAHLYNSTQETLVQQAVEKTQGNARLPVALYFDNSAEQQEILATMVSPSSAISYGLVRSGQGTITAAHPKGTASYLAAIDFAKIRGTNLVAEVGLTKRKAEEQQEGNAWWSKLLGNNVMWDLTIPILSPVNPNQEKLTQEQLVQELLNLDSASSLHVVGYMHLGICRTLLILSILPRLGLMALGGLLFVLASYLFSRLFTRRITAPFDNIVRIADDIAAGKPVQTLGMEKAGEFKELIVLLNSIIGNLTSYKTQMDVDHQLLSMKVEERTSQLSKRNEELKQAVDEVTKAKDRLRQFAYYDSLTALPNRRLFTEQLDVMLKLAKRNNQKTALLFLDLDNFKRINDSLGHSAGDLLLREVSKRLSYCVRESDVVGHYIETDSEIDVSRLGGDEFTVVLNQVEDSNVVSMVASRVIDTLIEPMTIGGHELVVTPSVGIAIAPEDAGTVEELLKAADTAMYHAKSRGKNNYVFFHNEMGEAGVDRLTMENDLRKAIERQELILLYQPQVDSDSGTVVGAEALVRWLHPERGIIPPFSFIPLAEEMGLIGELGDWCLGEACREMVALEAAGYLLPRVSVNVSALQFNRSLIERTAIVLGETGIDPTRLELELTEGIMMDGKDTTISALERLKAMGVRLSIDDFGTGYSSLSYLSRFPLDELKIDRSFVIDFDKGDNDRDLVIAIIAMAKSMNLELVAEGVETHEQYQFLRAHGASVIQGYLFSKPVYPSELREMLRPGYFQSQLANIAAATT